MKIQSDHEIFITKIYFEANFEGFTKFLNHENLELYGIHHRLPTIRNSTICYTYMQLQQTEPISKFNN